MATNQAVQDVYSKLAEQQRKVDELRQALAREELVLTELDHQYKESVRNRK